MASEHEVLTQAVKRYGVVSQVNMMFEEMSELQKELCKHLRGKDNLTEIAEEIADVEIMLAQMKAIFGCAAMVEGWRQTKVDRLANRLEREFEHDQGN